jgi:hypothetical protein
LSGGTEGEKMKAFRIACLQAEIWTRDVRNTKQEW